MAFTFDSTNDAHNQWDKIRDWQNISACICWKISNSWKGDIKGSLSNRIEAYFCWEDHLSWSSSVRGENSWKDHRKANYYIKDSRSGENYWSGKDSGSLKANFCVKSDWSG